MIDGRRHAGLPADSRRSHRRITQGMARSAQRGARRRDRHPSSIESLHGRCSPRSHRRNGEPQVARALPRPASGRREGPLCRSYGLIRQPAPHVGNEIGSIGKLDETEAYLHVVGVRVPETDRIEGDGQAATSGSPPAIAPLATFDGCRPTGPPQPRRCLRGAGQPDRIVAAARMAYKRLTEASRLWQSLNGRT
jgi:hypothetical protein